jgi:hypothetical protein
MCRRTSETLPISLLEAVRLDSDQTRSADLFPLSRPLKRKTNETPNFYSMPLFNVMILRKFAILSAGRKIAQIFFRWVQAKSFFGLLLQRGVRHFPKKVPF